MDTNGYYTPSLLCQGMTCHLSIFWEGTLDNETPNDFAGPSALRPARSKASAAKSNKKSGTANPLAAAGAQGPHHRKHPET